MQSGQHKEIKKSPCSTKNAPMPEDRRCGECGCLNEVWSDEADAVCSACGKSLAQPAKV